MPVCAILKKGQVPKAMKNDKGPVVNYRKGSYKMAKLAVWNLLHPPPPTHTRFKGQKPFASPLAGWGYDREIDTTRILGTCRNNRPHRALEQ